MYTKICLDYKTGFSLRQANFSDHRIVCVLMLVCLVSQNDYNYMTSGCGEVTKS